MKHLIMRIDAPIVSFGAPIVDNYGKIYPFPLKSLITGLLGSALGYNRYDHQLLNALQSRIEYAVRTDKPGILMSDYQVVDLSQKELQIPGWTTSGIPDERKGSAAASTHLRYRDYIADAVYTIVIALKTPDSTPTIDEIAHALQYPVHPLFIGRKTCIPSLPLYHSITDASSLYEALCSAPLSERHSITEQYEAFIPATQCPEQINPEEIFVVSEKRDWQSMIHTGSTTIYRCKITPGGGTQ